MSDEDGKPMRLQFEGQEKLPDGRVQILLRCKTVVDYATMPKDLVIGRTVLFKSGWDSDRGVAFFRQGGLEDLQGKVEE